MKKDGERGRKKRWKLDRIEVVKEGKMGSKYVMEGNGAERENREMEKVMMKGNGREK